MGELQPRRHAAVVVQRGDQDLVAGFELAAGGSGQVEVQRAHVRAEHDLVGLAAEEPRGLALGLLEDRLDPEAGGVARAEVRAGLAQRPRDRVADLVWDLRSAGRVEEREPLLERGEAPANGIDPA